MMDEKDLIGKKLFVKLVAVHRNDAYHPNFGYKCSLNTINHIGTIVIDGKTEQDTRGNNYYSGVFIPTKGDIMYFNSVSFKILKMLED